MAWKKDLLLIAIILAAAALAGGSLLSSNRMAAPPAPVTTGRDAVFRAVVREVDAEFAASWRRLGLTPCGEAPQRTVMRRMSLGLTGAIPSIEELRALEKAAPDAPLDWWVDHLLQDRRFATHVAERLARAFVGTDQGPFLLFRRERFTAWLADSLEKNTPYDELVRAMISGKGLWTGNPEVNFVTATLDQNNENKPDPIKLAGRTSRAFLGMRIDCLQCHDDQLGTTKLGPASAPREGTQEDFHRLAAFYSQASVSMLGIRDAGGDYRYKYLGEDDETVVAPEPPFLDELVGRDPDVRRREQLARWVTSPGNRPFARAAVNRVWAILFGLPLVAPIDDLPLHGPFPPAMERLADDFIASDYDLRRLIRMITSLRAFRIDSRSTRPLTLAHEKHWAAFPLTRLRPEQMAGSMIQASSLEAVDGDRHVIVKLKAMGEKNEFIRRYGDTGEDEFQDRGGTVPQRLVMMNGDLITDLTDHQSMLAAASRIATLAPNDRTAVETVYLATLTRLPSERERRHFERRLDKLAGRRRGEAVADLFWALMNCTEFSWNH